LSESLKLFAQFFHCWISSDAIQSLHLNYWMLEEYWIGE